LTTDRQRIATLDDIRWSRSDVHVHWAVESDTGWARFVTSIVYEDVDFPTLIARHGEDAVRRILFHVAMFEVNKCASFGATSLRIDPTWARYLTPELVDLWTAIVQGVWGQWRFERDLPNHPAPALATGDPSLAPLGLELPRDVPAARLWFCGGGKDSLLAAHVLESNGQDFDALAYGHSVYGAAAPQLRLITRLIANTKASAVRVMAMTDTAMEGDVLAAETPASVFAALPIALMHGYRDLIVAHERSANFANLTWAATGEDVNHQWGKSLEAERLLSGYIQRALIPELRYYSILQPVHDALIFASLRPLARAIPLAHSCNVTKPWCMRCAKCAYVWISYKAWLPWDVVDETFDGANLLDIDANRLSFRQLLGLEDHTPFECVGQIDETRLAFAMARARGLGGTAMAYFEEITDFVPGPVLDRYLAVDATNHGIPDDLAPGVLSFFSASALEARRFADSVLR
jgi:hypothetical protein